MGFRHPLLVQLNGRRCRRFRDLRHAVHDELKWLGVFHAMFLQRFIGHSKLDVLDRDTGGLHCRY